MTAMITRDCSRSALLFFLIGILSCSSAHATGDLEQHLRDEYEGKTLILRNFYSGKHLVYDANGAISGEAPSGDWTVDGVVKVDKLSVNGGSVQITAEREHLAWIHGALQPVRDLNRNGDPDKHERAKRAIVVELESGTTPPTAEAFDNALGKVFLTSKDDFVDVVPEYWRPCLMAAIVSPDTQYKGCTLPAEFLAIPGVVHSQASAAQGLDNADSAQPKPLVPKARGTSPPRVLAHSEPQFSTEARIARIEGIVTLWLVVDASGAPTQIRVASPIGCGLDAMAVDAVRTWRFVPAKKDGQPVPVLIAIETNFHLY